MDLLSPSTLAAAAAVAILLGAALLIARALRSTPPGHPGDQEANLSLAQIQTWLAEEADLPVDHASHALRVLRGRPDILRRLVALPAIGRRP